MPKQKVAATMEEGHLDGLNRKLERFRCRNHSHALEYALTQLIENEKRRVDFCKKKVLLSSGSNRLMELKRVDEEISKLILLIEEVMHLRMLSEKGWGA